jgi:mRNA interferase RelE/StbE
MRQLDITKQVDNFLDKLPGKQFKQVYTSIMELRQNATPHDSIKMKGSTDMHRVDIGEYRIIYKFDSKVVYIMTAGNRNDDDVYKKHGKKK